MRFIKKHKKLIAALTAMVLIAISLGTYVSQTWAAYDTWNSLAYLEFRTGLGEGQHSMKDVMPYGGNYTNDVGKVYSDSSHFFDDIRLDTMSRVTYGRKIRVDSSGLRLLLQRKIRQIQEVQLKMPDCSFTGRCVSMMKTATLYLMAAGAVQTVHGR